MAIEGVTGFEPDFGISVVEVQRTSSRVAHDFARGVQRDGLHVSSKTFLDAYRKVYNETYKLLLQGYPDDVPQWITILSNYIPSDAVVRHIKSVNVEAEDEDGDPLTHVRVGRIIFEFERPDDHPVVDVSDQS